jgi:hypothetical protein
MLQQQAVHNIQCSVHASDLRASNCRCTVYVLLCGLQRFVDSSQPHTLNVPMSLVMLHKVRLLTHASDAAQGDSL